MHIVQHASCSLCSTRRAQLVQHASCTACAARIVHSLWSTIPPQQSCLLTIFLTVHAESVLLLNYVSDTDEEDDVESDVTAVPTALQTAVGGPGEPCAAIGVGFNIGDVVEAPWIDGKLYVGVVWYTWEKDGVQEALFVHFDDCDSSNPISLRHR